MRLALTLLSGLLMVAMTSGPLPSLPSDFLDHEGAVTACRDAITDTEVEACFGAD